MIHLGNNDPPALLLSREMSHFLLRLQSVEANDSSRIRTKMLNYGEPFTAPFIAFDKILIDPSVGSFISPYYTRIEENPYFKKLKRTGSIEFADIDDELYESVVAQAAEITAGLLRNNDYCFPEALQPAYLLETPLYLFFKESEPFVKLVNTAISESLGCVEEIALVFSSCYSALLSEKLNIPLLTSRVGSKLIKQVPTLFFNSVDKTIKKKLLDLIVEETLTYKTIKLSVPNVTAPELLSDYDSFLDKALELRIMPGAQELRNKLNMLLATMADRPSDEVLLNAARTAVASTTNEIIAGSAPNRLNYLKRTSLSAIITIPLSLMGIVGGLIGQIGFEEVQYRLTQRKMGWFHFVFQNAPFVKLSH